MAVHAVQIGSRGRHVHVVLRIAGGGTGQGQVPALNGIPAARPGVTGKAGRAVRAMYRLNGLIEGNRHVGRIRLEHAVDLDTLVILLVADEAVNVLELVIGGDAVRTGAAPSPAWQLPQAFQFPRILMQ